MLSAISSSCNCRNSNNFQINCQDPARKPAHLTAHRLDSGAMTFVFCFFFALQHLASVLMFQNGSLLLLSEQKLLLCILWVLFESIGVSRAAVSRQSKCRLVDGRTVE